MLFIWPDPQKNKFHERQLSKKAESNELSGCFIKMGLLPLFLHPPHKYMYAFRACHRRAGRGPTHYAWKSSVTEKKRNTRAIFPRLFHPPPSAFPSSIRRSLAFPESYYSTAAVRNQNLLWRSRAYWREEPSIFAPHFVYPLRMVPIAALDVRSVNSEVKAIGVTFSLRHCEILSLLN